MAIIANTGNEGILSVHYDHVRQRVRSRTMWILLVLAATSCPHLDVVSSSAGLAGIRAGKVDPLTPETLGAWVTKRPPGCADPVTVWVERELPTPALPKSVLVEVKRFERESSVIIRSGGYANLPKDVRALYPHPPGEAVGFIEATIDQPTTREWTGPAYRLIPNPQTEITPPFVTVRSSKILYQAPGFAVTWSQEKTWLAVGGWPLPIRFIDDGRGPLPTEPQRAPLKQIWPGMEDAKEGAEPPAVARGCVPLALVSSTRGLTAIDGKTATPLENVDAAVAWVKHLRGKGCKQRLTWWHAEGTPAPAASKSLGPVTFATFTGETSTLWGERELRTAPAEVLERSRPAAADMALRVRIPVPYLSTCADPPGPNWKPDEPFLASLELQSLDVQAPFAVLDPKKLRWSGAEGTSGRCAPTWKEEDVLLRIPPTALPVRLAR